MNSRLLGNASFSPQRFASCVLLSVLVLASIHSMKIVTNFAGHLVRLGKLREVQLCMHIFNFHKRWKYNGPIVALVVICQSRCLKSLVGKWATTSRLMRTCRKGECHVWKTQPYLPCCPLPCHAVVLGEFGSLPLFHVVHNELVSYIWLLHHGYPQSLSTQLCLHRLLIVQNCPRQVSTLLSSEITRFWVTNTSSTKQMPCPS